MKACDIKHEKQFMRKNLDYAQNLWSTLLQKDNCYVKRFRLVSKSSRNTHVHDKIRISLTFLSRETMHCGKRISFSVEDVYVRKYCKIFSENEDRTFEKVREGVMTVINLILHSF